MRLPLVSFSVLAHHIAPALLLCSSQIWQPRQLTLTPPRKADAIKPEPWYRKLAPSARACSTILNCTRADCSLVLPAERGGNSCQTRFSQAIQALVLQFRGSSWQAVSQRGRALRDPSCPYLRESFSRAVQSRLGCTFTRWMSAIASCGQGSHFSGTTLSSSS